MNNKNSTINILLSTLVSVLLIVLSYLLSKVDPIETFLGQYINSQWQLVVVLLITFLLCWIIPYWHSKRKNNRDTLSNKILFNDYDHIDPPGYYKHKLTGRNFCKPCLVKNVHSELSTDGNGKLYCPSCNKPVEKILAACVGYDPPSPQRLTERFSKK